MFVIEIKSLIATEWSTWSLPTFCWQSKQELFFSIMLWRNFSFYVKKQCSVTRWTTLYGISVSQLSSTSVPTWKRDCRRRSFSSWHLCGGCSTPTQLSRDPWGSEAPESELIRIKLWSRKIKLWPRKKSLIIFTYIKFLGMSPDPLCLSGPACFWSSVRSAPCWSQWCWRCRWRSPQTESPRTAAASTLFGDVR